MPPIHSRPWSLRSSSRRSFQSRSQTCLPHRRSTLHLVPLLRPHCPCRRQAHVLPSLVYPDHCAQQHGAPGQAHATFTSSREALLHLPTVRSSMEAAASTFASGQIDQIRAKSLRSVRAGFFFPSMKPPPHQPPFRHWRFRKKKAKKGAPVRAGFFFSGDQIAPNRTKKVD